MEAKVTVDNECNLVVEFDPAEGLSAMLALEWLANTESVEHRLKLKIQHSESGSTHIQLFFLQYEDGWYVTDAPHHLFYELAHYIEANK